MKVIDLEEVNILKENIIGIEIDSEQFYKNTPHRLLDIFSHNLSVEEAGEISFAYEDLHFQNEYKQVEFFSALYRKETSQIIVEMNYRDMEVQDHINIMDQLDRYEKYLWLDHIVKTNLTSVTDFFRVEKFDDLKMLLQINSREIEFMNIHFIGLDVCFRGHYDMSMEMFFKREESILDFENMAREYNLYLRPYSNRD